MDTSLPRKAVDLLTAVASEPQFVPSYLRNLPRWRTPLQARLPWFSFGAIEALHRLLRPEHEVFEFGSGGSTLFFAHRCRRILSVENELSWRNNVAKEARAAGSDNAEVEHHPLAESNAECRGHPFFHAVQRQRWDVVVIDSFIDHDTPGCDGKGRFRTYAFELAQHQVKPGGLIVLDDSWMYPALLAARPGWSVRDYRGLGPCRYGVTSTALFTHTGTP